MKIKASAPGKLMLFGEHAVVYGYPCIVTAVNKRLYVEAEIIDGKEDEIIALQVKESRFVLETISYFRKKFKIDKYVRIKTLGDFSHNVGLGSSSAVTVATIQNLSELFKIKLSKKEIFNLSYKINLQIQGLGSGFDLAAATFGRTLYFVAGGKIIEPININSLPLVVGYSGIKADTPFYVRKVAEVFNSRKEEMKKIFEQIAILVKKAKKSLVEQKYFTTGKLMLENHELLQKLGVSIPKLDQMVNAAMASGAFGAKLSGAGGGDCMIALVSEEKRKKVESAIENINGEIISVKNNEEGVKIES